MNHFVNLISDWYNYHFNTLLWIFIISTILYGVGVIWAWPKSAIHRKHKKEDD